MKWWNICLHYLVKKICFTMWKLLALKETFTFQMLLHCYENVVSWIDLLQPTLSLISAFEKRVWDMLSEKWMVSTLPHPGTFTRLYWPIKMVVDGQLGHFGFGEWLFWTIMHCPIPKCFSVALKACYAEACSEGSIHSLVNR